MAYFDKYGVEFSDDRKTLVKCPIEFEGEYVIPEGVTIIGDNAFLGCSNLTTVIIPDSVSYIGISAFEECTSLFAVTIPDGVTSIGQYTFAECSSLNSVTIGNNVGSIGWGAFENCNRLTTIEIPNSVKRIGYGAFRNCSHLTSVKIPNGIISIEEVAFYGCTCLVSIEIPDTITNIGENVFAFVPNIVCSSEILGFPWGAKNANGFVDGNLVYSDSTKTKLLVCSPSAQGEIIIPEGVKRIGYNAFFDCQGLISVTIPDSVTCIEEGAFYGCSNLISIEVPNSVSQIGHNAFYGIPNVTYSGKATGLPWGAKSVNGYIDGNLVYSDSTKTKLLVCSPSAQGEIIIPESVKSIEHDAFFGCHGLTSIVWNATSCKLSLSLFYLESEKNINIRTFVFGNKVEIIPSHLCARMSKLNTIVIPNSVISIEDGAFSNCSGLTSIKIPNGVTNIGQYAFEGCRGLTSIMIPNSVTCIGKRAFINCSSMTSIYVADNCPNFSSQDGVLYNKDKTTLIKCPCAENGEYVIPNSVTKIGESAFQNCSGLTSIKIPDSVTRIEECAFYGCANLVSVTIPDSVISIEDGAFGDCDSLKEIIVPVGRKSHFEQMDSLQDLKDIIVECDNEELTILLNLAKAYELGIGVSQSIAQAELIYTQAAEKGCTEAAYRLAEWYKNGEVLPLDLNKAQDLYKQAARSGFRDAEEKVQKIQQKIEEEEKKRAESLAEEQKAQKARAVQEAQAKAYYLFFDTETTGLPPKGMYDASPTCTDIWPRMVQLAWIVTNQEGKILKRRSEIIYPDGFTIPREATDVHGITTERAKREGKPLREVLEDFAKDLANAKQIVCHNVEFDQHIVGAELYRLNMDYEALMDKPSLCTMLFSTNFCAIPNPNGYDDYKWPKLSELYNTLFNRDFEDAHDALADITATKDCFFELKRRGIIKE